MAGLPPLRYLRKTTIIVIVVFLAFLVHRVVNSLMENEVVQDVDEAELSLVQSVICRHIVRKYPTLFLYCDSKYQGLQGRHFAHGLVPRTRYRADRPLQFDR